MEVEYKKDLRHNYMVISKGDTPVSGQYSIKVLEHQTIDGILPIEQRSIDNKTFYYYEITAKQSMINILDRSKLSNESVKRIMHGILAAMERAYEYLIPEEDFNLTPEYIFMDVAASEPYICYIPGSSNNIRNQMNRLLEYLMNKIDYNDKDAVLLIYQLYAVSKEEEFTFDQIMAMLNDNSPSKDTSDIPGRSSNKERKGIYNLTEHGDSSPETNKKHIPAEKIPRLKPNNKSEDEINLDIPVMKERMEGEEEVLYYPLKIRVLIGGCILAGILIILLCLASGVLYNSFGNRVDYSKAFALMLTVLCMEGYLMNRLLDKKNKIAKLVPTCEYIDPRTDLSSTEKSSYPLQGNQAGTAKTNNASSSIPANQEDYNPTCVLNAIPDVKTGYRLKALDAVNYKDIKILTFPFFIGKLKKKVDYCLEKDVVSRFHAKLSKEGEQYFIMDLNSTNGTYVNSELLMAYQKKEIRTGDEIAFADIIYRFVNE